MCEIIMGTQGRGDSAAKKEGPSFRENRSQRWGRLIQLLECFITLGRKDYLGVSTA
jgi:hypothetical protein